MKICTCPKQGGGKEAKEAVDTAYSYLKANGRNISASISTTTKDYLIHVQDLNGIGMTKRLTLPAVVAFCSVALNKPAITSAVVLGEMSIGGTIMKLKSLTNTL